MEPQYDDVECDLFERMPDYSLQWRARAKGLETAKNALRQMNLAHGNE